MRSLGPFDVNEIGLGCMNLSHAYGVPPSAEAGREVLARALDLGIDHFDSAALYGFGRNEELVGPFLKPHRDHVTLASKCGMRGVDGKRTIDARPEMLRKDIEDSLRRLDTDVIDLYYLHRYDLVTPIEDSVGQMARFVEEGKVRALGLSEVSAETIRKASKVHPIAAVQSEYSLWSRNVEIAVLQTCAELGIAFVAFSPLARGFLTDTDLVPGDFAEKDIRRGMPRFQEPHFSANQKLLPGFRALAREAGVSASQLALRWVLEQGPNIHAIPGTTSLRHLEDDVATASLAIDADILRRAGELVSQSTVSGGRYPAATQQEIDTEEFA
jgi:aryl-alcohol dehydrogenase-like predicted oxidoreductase